MLVSQKNIYILMLCMQFINIPLIQCMTVTPDGCNELARMAVEAPGRTKTPPPPPYAYYSLPTDSINLDSLNQPSAPPRQLAHALMAASTRTERCKLIQAIGATRSTAIFMSLFGCLLAINTAADVLLPTMTQTMSQSSFQTLLAVDGAASLTALMVAAGLESYHSAKKSYLVKLLYELDGTDAANLEEVTTHPAYTKSYTILNEPHENDPLINQGEELSKVHNKNASIIAHLTNIGSSNARVWCALTLGTFFMANGFKNLVTLSNGMTPTLTAIWALGGNLGASLGSFLAMGLSIEKSHKKRDKFNQLLSQLDELERMEQEQPTSINQ